LDIFFADPDDIPLPPAEVRIRQLIAEPLEDGKRVRVTVELDPSQKPPCVDVIVSDLEEYNIFFITSVIETNSNRFDITIHLPGEKTERQLLLTAKLYFINFPGETPSESGKIETSEKTQERLISEENELEGTTIDFHQEVIDTKKIRFIA